MRSLMTIKEFEVSWSISNSFSLKSIIRFGCITELGKVVSPQPKFVIGRKNSSLWRLVEKMTLTAFSKSWCWFSSRWLDNWIRWRTRSNSSEVSSLRSDFRSLTKSEDILLVRSSESSLDWERSEANFDSSSISFDFRAAVSSLEALLFPSKLSGGPSLAGSW